jgi:hypothetical protein
MIINTAKAVSRIARVEYLQEFSLFMVPPPGSGEMRGKILAHSTNQIVIACILEKWLDCLEEKNQVVLLR